MTTDDQISEWAKAVDEELYNAGNRLDQTRWPVSFQAADAGVLRAALEDVKAAAKELADADVMLQAMIVAKEDEERKGAPSNEQSS